MAGTDDVGKEPATGRRVLGVVGTFVLDRIVGLPGRPGPVESLGGIAYTLSAVASVLPAGWSCRPIARVGSDAFTAVARWLDEIPLETDGLVEVPRLNNRVELRYRDDARRTEHLTGGVGGWSGDDLVTAARGCDALLINFISGHELDLSGAETMRDGFPGPVYADLHSLFLGMDAGGRRVPRPLPEWERWVSCFDSVQFNEDEMALLGRSTDPTEKADRILRLGAGLVACTLGAAGATCWTRDDGRTLAYEIPTSPVAHADPTGCGDVWAGVMCARLLAGDSVPHAGAMANRLAALAAGQSGVDGLARHLKSEARADAPDSGGSAWVDPTNGEEDH